MHTDQLRLVAERLMSENAKLQEKRQASTALKVLIAIVTAGSIGAASWLGYALWNSAREAIVRGYATTKDVTRLDSENTAAHKTISSHMEVIDDRTDMMFQVLVDGVKKDVAKRNIERKQEARKAAKIDEGP